ncbi:MAG: hypothetical protein LKF37_07125 [Lentilactobacillus diolivorans]|nr:hypothetical protein [Lentilactobacillus diolivorans]RRG02999.1 MAG: hypothetical protein DUD34_06775 [Lactobacillus sp.]
MKKKLALWGSIGVIASVGIGFLGAPSQPVQAAGTYHVIKNVLLNGDAFKWNGQSSKAFLWNQTLTKKLHHLTNYPRADLYASELLTMTNGKKTGYFYYVNSPKAKINGYVWRGYVKPERQLLSTKIMLNKSTSTNNFGVPDPSPAELSDLAATYHNGEDDGGQMDFATMFWQDRSLYPLFPGTLQNWDLAKLAETTLNDNTTDLSSPSSVKAKQAFLKKRGLDANDTKAIKFIRVAKPTTVAQIKALDSGQLPLKEFVLNDLKAQGVNPNRYKGWQIGIDSRPINHAYLNQDLRHVPSSSTFAVRYVVALFKAGQTDQSN